MDFHDFPRFLGKSGADLIQPPKICASLVQSTLRSARRGADSSLLGGPRVHEPARGLSGLVPQPLFLGQSPASPDGSRPPKVDGPPWQTFSFRKYNFSNFARWEQIG